jgi:uncharacterized protein YjiS (DUF1127 family)
MTTHIEQRTTIRPASRGLASAILVLFKAWRARRIERANIEALEALGPELLDDIGVTIVRDGREVKAFAACNPHAIAMDALSRPKKRSS